MSIKGKYRLLSSLIGKKRAITTVFRMLGLDASILDGGPGSGNFGHKGRPGKVGGSGGGGGSAYRTTSKSSASGYVGIQRAKAWKSIANTARGHADYNDFVSSLDDSQRNAIIEQHKQCGTDESFGDYAERIHKMLSETKAPPRKQNKPVDGKNIAAEYEYTGQSTSQNGSQEIDTVIEDVIHKQGFDGVPKVVSKEEFDKFTKEHPEMPILLRSYAAPNAEVLQDYDDMLEGGFWYVDCGTGGAQYGQGMYCAGCYGANRDQELEGALGEMAEYRNINIGRCYDDWEPVLKNGERYEKTMDDHCWIWNDEKMQKISEKAPEDGQEICISFRDNEGIEYTARTGTWKDGKLVFPGGLLSTGIRPEYLENSTWAPIERIDKGEDIKPVASTRMMTLDPSAKIITYDELCNINAGRITVEEYENLPKTYFDKTIDEYSLFRFTDDELEYMKYKYGYDDKHKAQEKSSEFLKLDGEIDENRKKLIDWAANEIKNEAMTIGMRELSQQAEERAKEYRKRFYDAGALAAALGYDAINADGHGRSGSYTVVLNRTKLIISEDRVDVA